MENEGIGTKEKPILLRIEEVARLLAISRTKAYELVNRGYLPSVTVGGLKRVPREALEALVTGE